MTFCNIHITDILSCILLYSLVTAKDEEITKLDNRIAAFRKKFDFLEQMEAKPQRSDKSRSRQFLLKDKKNQNQSGSPSKSLSGTTMGSVSPKSRKILGKDFD